MMPPTDGAEAKAKKRKGELRWIFELVLTFSIAS